MEVCEGGDLDTLVISIAVSQRVGVEGAANFRLPQIETTTATSVRWPAVRAIALDVARALQHLHSRLPPVSHRDVRSANVFLVDKRLLLASEIAANEVRQ